MTDVFSSSVMSFKGVLLTAVAEKDLIEVFSEFNHCWDILVEGFIAEFSEKASEIWVRVDESVLKIDFDICCDAINFELSNTIEEWWLTAVPYKKSEW